MQGFIDAILTNWKFFLFWIVLFAGTWITTDIIGEGTTATIIAISAVVIFIVASYIKFKK